MSVKIMGLVWDHYPRGGGELLTALALADHADHQGENVRPGITGLSRKTRQSVRTVQMHVAHMRRERWLQPVRYANGGRGFATEYRINPAWISNPADFAPFSETGNAMQRVQDTDQRVQTTTDKGADRDGKGCKAFAPQPSGTVLEPSTTTQTRENGAAILAVPDNGFPAILQGTSLRAARALLEPCPPECQQLVLDEVAKIAARGQLRRSPLGLLRSLVQCAIEGTFVPSRRLERALLPGSPMPATSEQATANSASGPKPSSEIARQALATIRANLQHKGGL